MGSINHSVDLVPVVILSTADYAATVWTNKQHIATRLSRGRDVVYIESLGLRSPNLNLSDLTRVVDRVIGGVRKVLLSKSRDDFAVPDRLTVVSPIVIPFHKYGIVRALNRIIIKYMIRRRLPKRYVLWTFSPLTYGVEKFADASIYHSVDLLHTLPGVPEIVLLDAEKTLVKIVDGVVASSTGVAKHIKSLGVEPRVWENVADTSLFFGARQEVRENRAIFVGNLTPSKIDFGLLDKLAQTGIKLVLAGPIGIDGVGGDIDMEILISHHNVEYLGVLTQEQMAIELGKSKVGLIPYIDNSYTSGVFPMKVYEYLAAGLPVVSTPIQSLRGRSIEGLSIVTGDIFVQNVSDLIAAGGAPLNLDLEGNSWDARLRQVEALIQEMCPNR